MADNILQLVQTTQRERIPVAQFLREWADQIENDGKVNAAIIVLHTEEGDLFRTSSRRCNMSKIEAIGLLQVAISDLCAT